MSVRESPRTVADFIEVLSAFPLDWPVSVSTQAGGGIAIEHRERGGKPFVAIFGSNGGRFGENPLTEEEYKKQSSQFLLDLQTGSRYTSVHGDHRTYSPELGSKHYDRRIIERMVKDGFIRADSVDIERVACLDA